MALKLFSQRESSVRAEAKKAEELSEIGLLAETKARLQAEINAENTEWETRRAEQRKVYSDEKAALQEEIRLKSIELDMVRAQIKDAMVPIEEIRSKTYRREEESQAVRLALALREDELEELILSTQAKLDELAEREGILQEGERSLQLRRAAVEAEALQVSQGHKSLNDALSDFAVTKVTTEHDLTTREARLEAKEKAFAVIVGEREKQLEVRESKVADRLRQIGSERQALNQAWAELKQKHA
jgi:hypothetical protein